MYCTNGKMNIHLYTARWALYFTVSEVLRVHLVQKNEYNPFLDRTTREKLCGIKITEWQECVLVGEPSDPECRQKSTFSCSA